MLVQLVQSQRIFDRPRVPGGDIAVSGTLSGGAGLTGSGGNVSVEGGTGLYGAPGGSVYIGPSAAVMGGNGGPGGKGGDVIIKGGDSTATPGVRSDRRGAFVQKLAECIKEGETIRNSVRIEPGRFRERFVIGRDGDRYYHEPDRHIIDFEQFVRWKTHCATVLNGLIPHENRVHARLGEQFNNLHCGINALHWAIGKLNAIKQALEQDLFDV